MNRRTAARQDQPEPASDAGFAVDYTTPQTGPWSYEHLDEDFSRRLGHGVARIESLKVKLLAWPGADDAMRADFFSELDQLRSSFLQLVQFASGTATQRDADEQRPAAPGVTPPTELRFEGIVGQSARIDRLLKILSQVAATNLTVLLEGETGTGKELFARVLHNNSRRKRFVAVNCGAFPPGLIESELFGHVRGAFTGASADRKGAFEEADGGTIFLDEVGELEPLAQVKLLRVLETGEIQRVGSDTTVRADVRVVSATNRDLSQMVADGRFREDLFYRLNVCPISIPPLRERRDEIPILLDFFVRRACDEARRPLPSLHTRLRQFLYRDYDFPGNIRELRNIAQYLAMLNQGLAMGVEDLPVAYQNWLREHEQDIGQLQAADSPLAQVRDNAERDYLESLASRHRGSITRIAAELKLSRSRAYQLFQKHALDPATFR